MGYGYWERSWCRSDVWWYSTDSGIYYWLDGYSETHGAHLVWGSFLNTYQANGYECGWLGAPLTERYRTATLERQDFEGGYIYRHVA